MTIYQKVQKYENEDKPVKKKRPRIKRKRKKYQILHPNLMGLKDRKAPYIFLERPRGYFMFIGGKSYIGFPKFIIENNPELFKQLEE